VNLNNKISLPPHLDNEEEEEIHEPATAEAKCNSKHLKMQVLPWSGKRGLLLEMGHFRLPSQRAVVQRRVLCDGPDHAEPTTCGDAGDTVPKIDLCCGTMPCWAENP